LDPERLASTRLLTLRDYRILDTPADPRFDALTELTATALGVPIAIITLVDEHRQWFKSRIGLDVPQTARDVAFCGDTIQSDEVLVVPDTTVDRRFVGTPLVTGAPQIRFYAGAPIKVGDQRIGTLAAIDRVPRRLTREQVHMLEQIALLAATELELWRSLAIEAERSAVEREAIVRRWASIIARSADLVLLLDDEGKILFASPSVTPTLGWTPAELIGTSIFELAPLDEVPENREQFAKTLLHGTSSEMERRARHRDGSWRLLHCLGRNLLGDPAVRAVVLTARDVTERRMAEQELARSEERLRQSAKLEAVGLLAGGIAHDFNNLLTVILSSLDFADSELPVDAPARPDLAQAKQAALRAATLTRRITAFGRRQLLQPTQVDLGEALDDVLEMLQRLLGERVRVELETHPDPVVVDVDRGQLEQVVVNLCVNARDAMPDGGRITLGVQQCRLEATRRFGEQVLAPGEYGVLSVSDEGIGMDAALRERIFEPYFTTKSVDRGSGLGLATVYGIVAQHGGATEVESTPGVGTTFRVWLPRATGVHPPATDGGLQSVTIGGTILVADDDPAVRSAARRILGDAGYHVLLAQDGIDAIATFRANRSEIRLVVLDAVMPRADGLAVVSAIHSEGPDVPVVMCSGYSDLRGGLPPHVHWLPKPYDAASLAEIVGRLLRAPIA